MRLCIVARFRQGAKEDRDQQATTHADGTHRRLLVSTDGTTCIVEQKERPPLEIIVHSVFV